MNFNVDEKFILLDVCALEIDDDEDEWKMFLKWSNKRVVAVLPMTLHLSMSISTTNWAYLEMIAQ